ncbi:hypothetical protein ACFLWU_04935 [Chloroflexota bacterium]
MSDTLKLYRGIVITKEKVDTVIKSIRSSGIMGNEGNWDITIQELQGKIDNLFQKKDLSTTDTRGAHLNFYKVICACGDEMGASYYALVHNKHQSSEEESYIIEFISPLKYLSIDGKDFLYPIFQFWDVETKARYELQSKTLSRLYGPSILKYFQKVANTQDQDFRIAMCDIACQDPKLVLAHSMNSNTIRGRYGVTFQSAFFIKSPLKPNQIIDIHPAKYYDFLPKVTLDDFRKGKLQDFVS